MEDGIKTQTSRVGEVALKLGYGEQFSWGSYLNNYLKYM